MERLSSVEEFNIIGIIITLVFCIILFVLFPISNRTLGDLFIRLSTILTQYSKVFKLRRKLFVPDSGRIPNTDLGREADEFTYETTSKLDSLDFCSFFQRSLRIYHPLVYLPAASVGDKKFNLTDTGLAFKWVIIFFAALVCWFWIIIEIIVLQVLSTTKDLDAKFVVYIILAVIGALLTQPVIFLIAWGFHELYLSVIKKIFKQCEVRARPDGTGNLNKSRLGFFQNQSFSPEVKRNLNSIVLKGFLVDASPEQISAVDEIEISIGDDAQEYGDKVKRNDRGFVEKFTVVSCGIVICLGVFAGIGCLALYSEAAKMLFISYCLALLIDILIFRVLLCLIISLARSKCGSKSNASENLLQVLDKGSPRHQITEDKLAQPTEAKVAFGNQEEPHNISILDRSQQSFYAMTEGEKRMIDFINSTNNIEDFNRLLVRRIYYTHDDETSDALIKKWKESSTTAEIQGKTPEDAVWNEARLFSEQSVSQKPSNPGTSKYHNENFLHSNIDEQDTKREDNVAVNDLSFSEPPNIAGGSEIPMMQTKLFMNKGNTGQVNPRVQHMEDEDNPDNEIDLFDALPGQLEENKDQLAVSEYFPNPEEPDEGVLNSAKGLLNPMANEWNQSKPPIDERETKGSGKKGKGKKGKKKGKSPDRLNKSNSKVAPITNKDSKASAANPSNITEESKTKGNVIIGGTSKDKSGVKKVASQASKNSSKVPGKVNIKLIEEFRADDKDAPDDAAIIIPGKGIPKAQEGSEAEPEVASEFEKDKQQFKINKDLKSDNEIESKPKAQGKPSSVQQDRKENYQSNKSHKPVEAFIEDKAGKDYNSGAKVSSGNSVVIPIGPFERTKTIIAPSEDSNAEEMGNNRKGKGVDMESEELRGSLRKERFEEDAKKGMRKQVFDLSDSSTGFAKAQRNRRLKKQLHKQGAITNKPRQHEINEYYNSRDEGDSEIIDDRLVQFKDNLYLSEGEKFSDNEDMVYYPKEDMTNYSKRMGLNRVRTKLNDEVQSDPDIFDQIKPSMLSTGKYSASKYESEPEDKLGQIVEDIKSENDVSMKFGDKNATISKRPSRQLQGRVRYSKKRRSYKPKVRSNSPKKKEGPLDYTSPYNELLYKRYREYHPEDIVSSC